MLFAFGRDEATRTPDPYVPNVVRYQLRYIPILKNGFEKPDAKVRQKNETGILFTKKFVFLWKKYYLCPTYMEIMQKILTLLMCLLCSLSMKAAHYIVVKAGDAESFLNAIKEANERNKDAKAQRLFILVPNGVYDLGERVLTKITGNQIAIIGESMDGTVVRNAPDIAIEGISKTATLQVRGANTYLQDLTIQNALKYYESGKDGRAVTIHDKGTRTICKNVRMLSHQDTYYTDNEDSQFYLEDSEIHGTVDFICGASDVYFNHCTIVTEYRTATGEGRNVIAAPRTSHTPWGYIFESCTIYNNKSSFHYARGWKETPHCIFLNTTLMTPEKLLSTRFEPRGMRTIQSDFKEYHTMDKDGNDITPKSNVITFYIGEEKNTVETILTAEEAKKYTLKNIFPNWRPEKITQKLYLQAETLKRKVLK